MRSKLYFSFEESDVLILRLLLPVGNLLLFYYCGYGFKIIILFNFHWIATTWCYLKVGKCLYYQLCHKDQSISKQCHQKEKEGQIPSTTYLDHESIGCAGPSPEGGRNPCNKGQADYGQEPSAPKKHSSVESFKVYLAGLKLHVWECR